MANFGKLVSFCTGYGADYNPSAEIINNATTLVRKLQGRRASSKLTEEEKQELIAQGKEVNEISSSHFSNLTLNSKSKSN